MDSNIAPEIERIKNAKENIKNSIQLKGVIIPEGTIIDLFPSYIEEIKVISDYPNAEDNTF